MHKNNPRTAVMDEKFSYEDQNYFLHHFNVPSVEIELLLELLVVIKGIAPPEENQTLLLGAASS